MKNEGVLDGFWLRHVLALKFGAARRSLDIINFVFLVVLATAVGIGLSVSSVAWALFATLFVSLHPRNILGSGARSGHESGFPIGGVVPVGLLGPCRGWRPLSGRAARGRNQSSSLLSGVVWLIASSDVRFGWR